VPSHFESFGIATLEAMFARLPVVGTRLGGFLDLVEEGVTGYLVEAGDIEALASRIGMLADDPSLIRKMGDAGYARAHGCHSTAAVIAQYTRCYRSLT
jgi:glycosyltransferase involved in cell wall biosynthesis